MACKIFWRRELEGPLAQVLREVEANSRPSLFRQANCFVLTCDTEHKSVLIQLERRYVDGGRFPIGRTKWVRNKAAYAEVEKAGQIRVITDLEAM